MIRRIGSGIVLTILLIYMFTLAFYIQPVEAEGTIYIRADGSIYPDTAPISSVDNVTYTFTDNIYEEIVVERDNIVVDGSGYMLQDLGEGPGIDLTSRNNVTIKNLEIKAFEYGIWFSSSTNNIVSGNNIVFNMDAIYLEDSTNNSIRGNNITNNDYGISLHSSSYNTISGNNITNNEGSVYLQFSSHNTISGNDITNNGDGIGLFESSYNTISENKIAENYEESIELDLASSNGISGNNITNNDLGIDLRQSSYNNISGNNIIENDFDGIYLSESSDDNIVSGNNITKNFQGVRLLSSYNNTIFHNNLVNNTIHATVTVGYANTWDNGYPSGGNYWSNYTGVDLFSGQYQNETGGDGIGDTPHVIDENNQDNYPLMKVYGGAHDIGIENVSTSKTIIGLGFNLNVTVKILNYGVYIEMFNLTVYANTTVIASQKLILSGENSKTIAFTWNTTGAAKGNYTIKAVADTVPGEADTIDNTYVDNWIIVAIVGDITGPDGWPDAKVDIRDVALVAKLFGVIYPDPDYDPNCDLTGPTFGVPDGKIDIRDVALVAKHFGDIDP